MSIDCDVNFEYANVSEYEALRRELTLWARIRNFPLYATFELTPYCNLQCPMCYVRLDPIHAAKQGKLMTGKQWLEIARQARDMGLLFMTLTGGEPFLHPDFWEIYDGVLELGLLPNIYTNGCLINEEIVERLKKKPPHNIKISVYGASNETYEKMCGVKDGYTKVCHAIDLLKEAGLDFFCTTTVVRENRQDIAALYAMAREKGIRYFHTIAVTNTARDALSDPLKSRMSSEEAGWSLERLEQEKRKGDYSEPFAACGGYAISFFLTWHGHMQFCGFSSKPYVQITEPIDVKKTWEDMIEETRQITTPKQCASCPHAEFCKRCPGLLAAESGDPSVASPAFCKQAIELHRLYDKLKEEAEAKPQTNG